MIAHSDTDHYHIHTYLSNNYAGTGKTIRFWFNENDLTAIKEFISLKYDLDLRTTPKAGRTRKVGSSHWKGEAKKKEEAKDEIHEVIMEDVLQGKIKDNQEVREKMELYTALSEGTIKEVEVKKTPEGIIEIDKSIRTYGDKVFVKLYKNSISIIKRDGLHFTLRGGIYRNDWTAQKNVLKVKEVLDNVIKYLERKMKETQRYDKDRQKRKAQQPEYKTEILGKDILTFLKKIKQNQQTQNQQNQKQPQQKQPQHQKQPQPQKQNQPTRDQQNLQEQYYLQDYQQETRPKMML
jgi:single-stranded DNA-binding protein